MEPAPKFTRRTFLKTTGVTGLVAARGGLGDSTLITNRGIGLCDLPIRFNCPPEVTELTLVRA